jgi:hypothetical protein
VGNQSVETVGSQKVGWFACRIMVVLGRYNSQSLHVTIHKVRVTIHKVRITIHNRFHTDSSVGNQNVETVGNQNVG